MSKLGLGEIEVSLNSGADKYILRPTIRAMNLISRQFGGMAPARAQLVSENFDAAVFILRIGAGLNDRDARSLDEKIFKNGLSGDLLISLIRYCAILGNGGKPLPDDVGDGSVDAMEGDLEGKDSGN